ncbi:MAG: transposase [Phycisphaerales bacterium]
MVVGSGEGLPVGVHLDSASPAEVNLVFKALKNVRVPRRRGRPRTNPKRLIADRGYDSELIRRLLRNQRTEPIIPYRRSVKERRYDDGRKLRRYRKRWKIERLIAWLANFRRLVVRYDRNILMYQGFLHPACLIITLRQF